MPNRYKNKSIVFILGPGTEGSLLKGQSSEECQDKPEGQGREKTIPC